MLTTTQKALQIATALRNQATTDANQNDATAFVFVAADAAYLLAQLTSSNKNERNEAKAAIRAMLKEQTR